MKMCSLHFTTLPVSETEVEVSLPQVSRYSVWRGVLLGILGRGVPPDSPNPDAISGQKMPFPTPVFRPGP